MDFFFKKVAHSRFYKDACERNDCFPIAYHFQWYGLQNYEKYWLNNPFVRRNVFMELLWKTMQTRRVLWRFFKRSVFEKRCKKNEFCNMFDFSMTPVAEIKPSLLFFVREDGHKYAFQISDFFNIIKQAITRNIEIHPAPTMVVNPYTRAPFRHETLYLFFLKVYESNMLMPMLFHQFVKAGFDLNLFLTRNECLLREYAIRSTVEAMPAAIISAEVRAMLNDMRVFDALSGSYKTVLPNVALLPSKSLTIFKPWLHLYYVHLYSLSPTLREKSYKKIFQAMVRFIRDNPEFGVVRKGVVRSDLVSLPETPVGFVC